MDIVFRARRWRDRQLAERICQLIYGVAEVRCDDDGRRWHIGIMNDWWLHPLGDERWRLVYRYARRERMEALAEVMEWLLGVEPLEDGR